MVNWRLEQKFTHFKLIEIKGGEYDSNLAYGGRQLGAASPISDRQMHTPHPDLVPFDKLIDQTGPPSRPPASEQQIPFTKNGIPKDKWTAPREQPSIGHPKNNMDSGPTTGRQGPGIVDGNLRQDIGQPYVPGAPSTQSTPGFGPTNTTSNYIPEFPSSGRSSGNFLTK